MATMFVPAVTGRASTPLGPKKHPELWTSSEPPCGGGGDRFWKIVDSTIF